jgi:hypothetical protein
MLCVYIQTQKLYMLCAQNKIISNQGAEQQITEMVRGNQVDIQQMCVGNQEQTAESEQEIITGVHH